MAKFALECPKCGTMNTASTFIFSKKTIKCSTCSSEINVKDSKLISKKCPHCQNTLVFDQSKKKQFCPICGKPISHQNADSVGYKMVTVNCPQCACAIEVDKTVPHPFCPICDYQLDLEKELNKAKLVSDTGVSVIQYEGDNSTFIWKHPIEDFNLGTQLTVHESQEAIFFMNGEALDTFGPGRHTLETENLPILKKIYNLPTGKQTPFHAEVYFINKTVHMGLKWGTDSRVRFIDPITGVPLDIGACGELNMQVENGRKLLVKLVGTTGGIGNKEILSAGGNGQIHTTLNSYFRAPLMSEVKSHLASVIKELKINILEIDQHMSAISESLRQRITPKFEEYGLTIPNFYITNISLPEDDPNFQRIRTIISDAYLKVREEELKASVAEAARKTQLIEEQTKAELKVIGAQGDAAALKATGLAEAEVMQAKGYSHKDELEAEVQKAYAAGMGQMGANGGGAGGGGGSLGGDIVNMMAQMKMASTMMDKMDFMNPGGMGEQKAAAPAAPAADTWTCACGEAGNTKNFCMNCGSPKPQLWTCVCGHSGNKGAFCEMCGKPKGASEGWDCSCGHSGNKGAFCEMCGKPKAEPDNGWDCACGAKGNKGNFCAECGAKKEGTEEVK